MSYEQLDLDAQLCFPLHTAARAVTRAYGTLLAESGLTYPQYLVMLALWKDDAPQSVGELGEKLRLDTGTLTPLLKRLEAAGHLERRRSVSDERKVLITVTPQGLALRDTVADVPQRLASAISLEEGDAERLKAMLGHIMEALDAVR
ncbi:MULTISPECIES: MarR family transcriptional regulator [Arthrobacter]|uniref:MarR family transcriptional regulator n=2 Tax=Arthrobacter TaxID=1663 RepID=A0ABU9KLE5_9MICC|nr:MarR family transcriptional regulator [Arthrobacter sp. YJM1]MDP5227038.1 MarR family transcriptional regulator [Arthrobacter sp. YJM1]